MSVRIPGGGVSARNPFGPSWNPGKAQVRDVGQQVQDTLFGKPKPPVLDADDADTAAQMARLHAFRRRLARLAGDREEDYDLVLSEGTIAMIDDTGRVYVGRRFLLDHADNLPLLVGVLAHEIGHRPRRWAEYKDQQNRTREEIDQLCRVEETRADHFSGVALAELRMPAAPLIEFLKAIQVHPHPQYFSAEFRAQAIMEGHGTGARRSALRNKFFPEFARMTSASGDLGDG